MKKKFVWALFAVWMMSCGSTPKGSVVEEGETGTGGGSVSNASDIVVTDITEKEWKLTEVRINNRDTGFNRNGLVREGFDQFFTLNFDANTVNGTGAPNLCSAPYTLGGNQSIKIMPMRATLMASFYQPENLTEHDFFTYLQNAHEWKLANNRLELRSKTASGGEVILIFS